MTASQRAQVLFSLCHVSQQKDAPPLSSHQYEIGWLWLLSTLMVKYTEDIHNTIVFKHIIWHVETLATLSAQHELSRWGEGNHLLLWPAWSVKQCCRRATLVYGWYHCLLVYSLFHYNIGTGGRKGFKQVYQESISCTLQCMLVYKTTETIFQLKLTFCPLFAVLTKVIIVALVQNSMKI